MEYFPLDFLKNTVMYLQDENPEMYYWTINKSFVISRALIYIRLALVIYIVTVVVIVVIVTIVVVLLYIGI